LAAKLAGTAQAAPPDPDEPEPNNSLRLLGDGAGGPELESQVTIR